MDKNTIIGIVLIFAVLIIASLINRPSKQQIEALRRQQDSLRRVELAEKQKLAEELTPEVAPGEVLQDTLSEEEKIRYAESQLGAFGPFSIGEERFIRLENNLVRLTLSTKGGRIYSVELKDYKRYDGSPLVLFDGPANQFGLNFFSQNRMIRTEDLYFVPSVTAPRQVTGPEVKTRDKGNEEFNRENPCDSSSVAFRL